MINCNLHERVIAMPHLVFSPGISHNLMKTGIKTFTIICKMIFATILLTLMIYMELEIVLKRNMYVSR
jgi:hypothetical protein